MMQSRDRWPAGPMGPGDGLANTAPDESPRRRALPFPWDEDPQPVPRSLSGPLTETHPDQDTLWRSQKLESLGLLAGSVAHEFNNCLLSILGNTDLLEPAVRETDAELVTEIRHAAQRAGELCRQLQAFAGRGVRGGEPLDVSAVIRAMVPVLKVAVPARHELRLDLADGLPPVVTDPTRLRQVVMNLVVNAAESMGSRSGRISVGTRVCPVGHCRFEHCIIAPPDAPARFVCLTVADTGPGMEPPTVARAFDPFFSTKPQGRGLGLASVLGIVRSHRGGVAVDTVPGHGTTVTVLLPPREDVAVKGPAGVKRAAGAVRAGTVLVVDDEEYVRVLASRMVTRIGYPVLLAADGAEALALVRERGDEIGCVLLDLVMPVMDGGEVLAALRRERPELPVLLTSGYREEDIQPRFAGRGAAGFLQKPYRLEELGGRLAGVIGYPPGAGGDRDGA